MRLWVNRSLKIFFHFVICVCPSLPTTLAHLGANFNLHSIQSTQESELASATPPGSFTSLPSSGTGDRHSHRCGSYTVPGSSRVLKNVDRSPERKEKKKKRRDPHTLCVLPRKTVRTVVTEVTAFNTPKARPPNIVMLMKFAQTRRGDPFGWMNPSPS